MVLGDLGDLLLLQVLVHSTVQWGLKHKQLTLPEAEKHLATAMAELFPNWPKPKELKTLKWLYSQVELPTQAKPILLKIFLCHTDTQPSGRRVYPQQHSTHKALITQYVLPGAQKLPRLTRKCRALTKSAYASRRYTLRCACWRFYSLEHLQIQANLT